MLLKIRQALHLRRAIHLVWQSSPGWTLASMLLLVLQGILPLLSLYLTKLMVDTVSTGLTTTDKAAALGHVMTLVVLAGVVALAGNSCSYLVKLISVAQT